MIACGRSDGDGCGGAERFGPLPPQLQLTWSAAESSGCGPGNGCGVERARQADRSVLLHGLCAVTIALATARVLPASAFAAFTALAECLVGVCVLSLVIRTLSWSRNRLSGPCGRRSVKTNAIDRGCPKNGDRSVPQQRPLAPPPATTSSGGDALPLVKRGLRLLMRVMRGVQRSIVIRPKRCRRSTRQCHNTAARRSVTTITACSTAAKTSETVTGSRADNDYTFTAANVST